MVSNVPLTPSQPVVRQTSISCTFRPILAAAPGGTVAVEILDLFGGPGPVFPRPHHITYPLSLDGAQPFSFHEPSGVTFTMREIGVPPVPDHTSVPTYPGAGPTLGAARPTRRLGARS